jgi:hypothetical protein
MLEIDIHPIVAYLILGGALLQLVGIIMGLFIPKEEENEDESTTED